MISRARETLVATFFTQILPAFNITTFSKFLFVLFCVRPLDSLINYSFFNEFCI